MPKNVVNSEQLRQARIQDKIALSKKNIPSAEIYLCVLGNGGVGAPSSLYMFTDHSRYLFNCGEGTQRLAHEYKMKLSKLNHIFITHNSWKNVGGLLGLSLTVQDISVPQITLHGPPNIENIYKYSTPFIILKNLAIEKQSHEVGTFVDECMEVQYVPITNSINSVNGKKENTNHCNKKQKTHDSAEIQLSMAYICKGHSKPGRLNYEKCIAQGVPKGPLFGQLKNGQDVKLPSGKIVYSRDVMSEDEECPVFIVVECPSESFLQSLLNEEKFKSYQTNGSARPAALVAHFTPASVIHTSDYQKWIKMFPQTTVHLFLNENCTSLNSISNHHIQHMLNLIHPNVFQLLYETEANESVFGEKSFNNVLAKSQERFYLRPYKGLDRRFAVQVDVNEFIETAKNTPGFSESLEGLQKNIEKISHSDKICQYPEIVFLGTGSCIPSKIRNVSSILVNINEDCNVILDCGEGTYNQLIKNYGQKRTRSILLKTCCIFLSHVHADHHLGLFSILIERQRSFNLFNMKYIPVIIIGPYCLENWIDDYDNNFSNLYRFIDCSRLEFQGSFLTELEKTCLSEFADKFELITVPVIHCPNSYGVVLHLKSDWKLVYSGDTIPCKTLVDAGSGCDLLIHEATMEDDLADEAALKMHSTTSQAIQIAEQMKAKYTILTHFSQRYAKVPLINEEIHNHIGFAFDNMKICASDLPILPLFIPSLRKLFAEHVEKLQERGNKRKEKLKIAPNVDSAS